MLPTSLGIGTVHRGTNWMRLCVRDDPEVFVPEGLGVPFFDRNYEKGTAWYESHFPDDGAPFRAVGEITAEYLANPESSNSPVTALSHYSECDSGKTFGIVASALTFLDKAHEGMVYQVRLT